MSIKIYNAYKLDGGLEKVQSMQGMYNKAVSGLDGLKKYDVKTIGDFYDLQVMVYCHNRDHYIQTFGSNKAQGLFEQLFELQDFHYQDQSDPWYVDEDLTTDQLKEAEKEYDHRRQVWDEIFERSWTPSQVGFTIQFLLNSTLHHNFG